MSIYSSGLNSTQPNSNLTGNSTQPKISASPDRSPSPSPIFNARSAPSSPDNSFPTPADYAPLFHMDGANGFPCPATTTSHAAVYNTISVQWQPTNHRAPETPRPNSAAKPTSPLNEITNLVENDETTPEGQIIRNTNCPEGPSRSRPFRNDLTAESSARNLKNEFI